MEKIKIRYHADIDKIEPIANGNWIDLRAAEDVFIPVGEYKMFSLGVSMELPEGYEAIVAPRSSTFRKYGIILVNSIGVIDNSFNGDDDIWQYLAFAVKGNKIVNGRECAFIPKNDRICQFRILKNQPEIEFEEVETLGNEARGGIGSTGRR
jgi:dUTP pyrophosphatase